MQNFSYHMHTNCYGIFDGMNTIEEMIIKAKEAGYVEMGISNHLCYHPKLQPTSPLLFNDADQLKKVLQRNIEDIRRAGDKHPDIKIYAGLEVDGFPHDSQWRLDFEKIIKGLKTDYLIGANHFLYFDSDSLWNLYSYSRCTPVPDENQIIQGLHHYWDIVALNAQSGYFDFIAHLDVCQNFPEFKDKINHRDGQWKVIEALEKSKTPYELNTSGWRKRGMQNPTTWMLEELNKRGVPIVISDDAHSIAHVGYAFAQAEKLLADLNYKNRWKIKA